MELTDATGTSWPRFEPSGVVQYRDRLVMVDDDINDLFLYSLDGKFIEKITSPDFPQAKAKFEDLAYDPAEDRFYVMTPHALAEPIPPGNEALAQTLQRRSLIYSFQLDTQTPNWRIRPGSVKTYDLTAALKAADLPYGTETMALEGLAIDPNGGWVTIGFRRPEPMLYRFPLADLRSGKAPTMLTKFAELNFTQRPKGEPDFKISGLHYDINRKGLWVLASTEGDQHRYHGSELWFWPDPTAGQAQPAPRLVLPTFDPKDKAEGIGIAPNGDAILVYDNDQGSVAAEGQTPLDFVGRMRTVPAAELSVK